MSEAKIVVSADDRASAVLSRISKRLDGVAKPAQKVVKSFGNVVAAATVFTGVVAAATAGAFKFANNAVNAADRVGDLSARFAISAKSLQVYGSMVEESGGSLENAAEAMGKLTKAQGDAIGGSKEAIAAFRGIGISVKELRSMKPEQIMERMSDAFARSQNDVAKMAVINTLMGRSGTVFMDVLNKGAEAYRDRLKEMREDGALLSDDHLEQADAYDRSWSRLMRTFNGVKTVLGVQLASGLQSTVDKLQKWIVANRELIGQKFDKFIERLPEIIKNITIVVEKLWSGMSALAGVFSKIYNILGPTGTAFAILGAAVGPLVLAVGKLTWGIGGIIVKLVSMTGLTLKAAAAFKGLWAICLAHPFVAIGAAAVALGVVIYKNWDSIVEYIKGAWEKIKGFFPKNFFDDLIQVWLGAWKKLGSSIAEILKNLRPDKLIGNSLGNLVPDSLKSHLPTSVGNFLGYSAPSMTAAQAAAAQNQAITNSIDLRITQDGRAVVDKIWSSDKRSTDITVDTGVVMQGGW